MNRRVVYAGAFVTALASVPVNGRQPKAPAAPPLPPAVIFAALAGGANPAPQTVTIATATSSPMQVTSVQPSWLTVTVTNQGSQATATVSANLQGVAAAVSHATIEFTSADRKLLRKLTAWLLTVKPLPDDSAYQVEFRMTGYAGDLSGYPDCAVNPQGFDVLQGIVTGRENVPAGEDVRYTGTLGRLTAIDLCGTKGKKGPGDDELVWCAASLVGVASMKVQLDVYGEAGRGGWLNAKPDGSWFTGSVQGACETADMTAWEKDYPGGESGGSPDGQAIDESTGALPRLFAAGRARLVPGTFVPHAPGGRPGPASGWTLNVIKKLK